MHVSLMAAGWLLGICVAQQWRQLPDPRMIGLALGGLLVVSLLAWRRQSCRQFLCPMLATLIAMGWVTWLAQARLSDRLANHEDDKVTRVSVLVSDLPTPASDGVRFTGVLLDPSPSALPKKLMVFWPGACAGHCVDPVKPGQQWRMALRFRQPRSRLNFAGMDGESWMFAQGLRATATVRGKPVRLADATGWQPSLWIEQLRNSIRQRLHRLLGNAREVNVMVALAIGDQQGVSREDWEIFNLTGITHLVSISGSHVTLIAALGATVVAIGWRRFRWRGRLLTERVAVRLVFVWAAGVLAFLYCLLAGWGVPAQRTFFMLAAGALSLSGRIPLSGPQAVLAAGTAMTVLDPWAVMSTGFWLSFGAMVILIFLAEQVAASSRVDISRWEMIKQTVMVAARLQWVMTLAITPVTVYLFQQLSVIGLLANAWAIPWITFLATPLALLLSALCVVPLPDAWLAPIAWLAHAALYGSLAPVRWLAKFDGLAIEARAIGLWELGLGIVGVAMALLLPPWRCRRLAWLLLLPSMTSTTPRPPDGGWRLTALDIGQGGAVLVQTKSHNLLFDTGWRYGDVDATDRVILPELRALGIKHLDAVVVSHPDNDHLGGLERLEQTRSIGQLIGSGLQRKDVLACRTGQSWTVDGVRFEFLHPDSDCSSKALSGIERNRCSCVLAVHGRFHRLLLTGDIDASIERALLTRLSRSFDVVMVAHHGSHTSSDPTWVRRVNASHAVAQAGQYNRFGHPHAEVVQRWQAAGTRVWVSSDDGAVRFDSSANGLVALSARQLRQRYWHTPVGSLK
ncbi:DNA internalization-related competence protein ComEC/Rec2 [Orrella daihaiensis]|uniref:DNA internalization-related competence protein ComEC/Rec2 n=1 Tax=Orrella daihaiensis TaxID=2782176 RepID=A0ABY4AG79_9BURK|nr:DNA internalization-related competence protein ComEC/Rec2 [Orrella daihaiensis]UOD49290.1 DNA internalization-related competence protein ComEC/Rec2 [Orrella daihaiensis]